MTDNWPRGKSENQRLEFKGRDALKDMKSISKEVAAMLNASGGVIWIGIAEEAGIAVRVEPIKKIKEPMLALWNYLVDALDPIPSHEEVSIEPIDTSDGPILRIDVKKHERKPYAYRRDGLRFVRRLGPRVQPMTSQELRDLFAKPATSTADTDTTTEPILKARDRILEEKQPRLWVRLQPSRSLGLDYKHQFVGLCLTNPEVAGNRDAGVTFPSRYGLLRIEQNQQIMEVGSRSRKCVRVHKDGWIDCVAPLTSIGREPLIWPVPLSEMTASAFRMAKALYESVEIRGTVTDTFHVAASLALFGARGWRLPAGSPKWMEDPLFGELEPFEAADLLLERPLVFQAREIIDEPDRCAYRLLIPVYESFGYSEDKIPSEFDRPSGRLILPS